MFVKIAQELEREILECQSRPMKELQHMEVGRELFERGDLRMRKSRVGFFDDRTQYRRLDVVCEHTQELETEFSVAQSRKTRQVTREIRERLR